MKNSIEGMMYCASSYLRISKEDGDKAESDSIANQRDLIHHFLSDKPEIQLLEEHIDDGYSGAVFDRPAFQRMLEDVRALKINCIIVKDLSRLGRNFVEAGRYIDQIFPEYGVRFISINDNFDSVRGRSQSDNVLLPFINLVNDAFCRDISIKVRSQLEIKRKKGDFIGSFAVFGYQKNPNDRHKLIPDEFAASVVRDIFKWKTDGASQQKIADKLNEHGIPSPMEYKRSCGMSYRSGFWQNPKSRWTAVAVGRILRNEYYIGTLVQGRRTTPNHKVKKVIEKPSKEWVRIENNHEPVVSAAEFATVQRLLSQDTRIAPEKETVSLFSGLIFCGDCGQNMVKNGVRRGGKAYSYYICCQNRTTKGCSSHRIPEQTVIDSALLSLKQHIASIVRMERILKLIDNLTLQQEAAQKADARLKKKQAEIGRCQRLKATLYESLTDGLLDKQEYLDLKLLYDAKMQDTEAAKQMLLQELDNILQNRTDEAVWLQSFIQYQNIEKLNRRFAVTLINKILVFEDCRLEIKFQYGENYERTLKMIESFCAPTPAFTAPVVRGVG